MLRFFSKIRKSLLDEGKAARYTKYAIGEIFLVVIGILIALQINNWNEDRQARVEQQKLLANLKLDFESRLHELKEFRKARLEAIDSILELNQYIARKGYVNNENKLNPHIARTFNGFLFNEDFKMLDVLFTTGLINEIRDERLKRKLIKWPQEVEEMLEEQRLLNYFLKRTYRPFLMKYLSLRQVVENFDFREYNLPKGAPTTKQSDFQSLLKDPLLENYLVNLQMLHNVMNIDYGHLISSAEEIIQLIEEEL